MSNCGNKHVFIEESIEWISKRGERTEITKEDSRRGERAEITNENSRRGKHSVHPHTSTRMKNKKDIIHTFSVFIALVY